MASAHQQLSDDVTEANSYKTIDMIDLLPHGASESMAPVEDSLVRAGEGLVPVHGRLMALSQAAEFEAVVYSYDLSRESHVTPLVPRGFVEDMSLYAQVPYDPVLGIVLVEHGLVRGQGDGSINVKLVDQWGGEVGNGWYYA